MPADQPAALIAVSAHGRRLAALVRGELIQARSQDAIRQAWTEGRPIVFFGAAGIAVRLLAPLLADKRTDPAVVVVDDGGRHAISLVGGHEAGANALAIEVARQLGAEPVISTASEVLPERRLALGIGCSRGATAAEIEELVKQALRTVPASLESVRDVGSADLKASEPGLREFAERWHLPLRFFSADELRSIDVPNPSKVVEGAVGTPAVAEAAALLLAGPQGRLVVEKQKAARVTVAISESAATGQLSIVGIGPGGKAQATQEAFEALRQADVIVGYTAYVDMVREWLPGAQYEALPIGQELERAGRALELARAGRRVALVCSGDAGVYGLTGLVYEQLAESDDFPIRAVPGVTAATSAAALLGAPLMADFLTISLSDLLTPAGLIIKRLEAAAEADLVAVIYNPASQRRRALLAEAQRIFLLHRPPSTPVGLVRNAYRPEQSVSIVALGELPLEQVDMFTTLVIGNSQTVARSGRMVTKRRLVEREAP